MSRTGRGLWIGLLVCVVVVTVRGADSAFGGQPRRTLAAGSPQQIGQAVGQAHGATAREIHPMLVAVAMALCGQPPEVLNQRAAKIAQHIDPADIAEMRALAEAAEMKYEEVLFINCFYTLTTRRTMACRGLAVWGDATVGGRLIHARNLDWIDYPGGLLNNRHLILNVAPEGGYRYLLLTWPGLTCAVTGTNEKGITVSFNQLFGGNREDRLAEPTFFTLKRILKGCDNLDDAIAMIQQTKPLDDGSVLISDAMHRSAAVVEMIDGRIGVRRAAEGQTMIGNANHATEETGVASERKVPMDIAEWPTCYVAKSWENPIDATAAQQILADRLVLQGPINILAVVIVPDDNAMWLSVAPNHAAQGTYTRYELFPKNE